MSEKAANGSREALELSLRSILDDDDALSAAQIVLGEGWRPPHETPTNFSLDELRDLRVATDDRLAQSERLLNTTRDASAWQDYLRAVRYFEAVARLITAEMSA